MRSHGDHTHVDWDVQLVPAQPEEACALARGIDEACAEALERLRARLEAAVAAA